MADQASGEAAYPWLNEFLCDYVDGTMDPAARAMFEECVQGNPDLVAYVERLRETRHLLCSYGCRDLHAPCNLHQMLHRRIAQEALHTRGPLHLPNRLGLASVMFAAMLVAMVGSGVWLGADEEFAQGRTAGQSTAAVVPVFYMPAAALPRTILPDTLPRSSALLRIRATGGAAATAP